jgi:hypothetical protein
VTTEAGLRPTAKAADQPPDPKVGALLLDSTEFIVGTSEVVQGFSARGPK